MSTNKLTAGERETIRQIVWEELQWLLSRTDEATIEQFYHEIAKRKVSEKKTMNGEPE